MKPVPLNRQEVFNKVVRGLHLQGGPSIGDGGCLYRGPNGRKCGIGHLITDEHYDRNIEGNMAASGDVINCVRKSLNALIETEEDFSFLVALQKVHDAQGVFGSSVYVSNEYRKIAVAEKLEWPSDVPRDGWTWL